MLRDTFSYVPVDEAPTEILELMTYPKSPHYE